MKTPSYYCTWAAQNYLYGWNDPNLDAAVLEGDSGSDIACSYMREDMMLVQDGPAGFYPAARKNMFFLLDYGWDVALKETKIWAGSCLANPDRFPGCPEQPWERLKYLNDRAMELGWGGIAIWLAAQVAPVLSKGRGLSEDEQERYWRERMEWSEWAGVRYWKIDWGKRQADIEFRINMTRWARDSAPNLLIEHAYCQSCVNDSDDGWRNAPLIIRDGRVNAQLIEKQAKLLEHVDILRTYDVFGQLSVSETIERIGALLKTMEGRKPTGLALLNCEDECYIGASLGLCVGVMRHPMTGKRLAGDPDVMFPRNDRQFKRRMDEVTRTVVWQQIMPAFGVCDEEVYVSEDILIDSWTFSKGETWLNAAIGQTIPQSAPAIISRGMPLPEVKVQGEHPFVTAARHGANAAVAAHGRVKPSASWYEPLADVTITLDDGVTDIGVFGHYRSLTICGMRLKGMKIAVRDLCDEEWQELVCDTDELVLRDALIEQIGLMNATPGDLSAPGMHLKIG
jgi:hypothetical protein